MPRSVRRPTLGVTPEWLLLGENHKESGKDEIEYYTIKKDTDVGRLIAYYEKLEPHLRERVMGYTEAFASIKNDRTIDKDNKNTK